MKEEKDPTKAQTERPQGGPSKEATPPGTRLAEYDRLNEDLWIVAASLW